MDIVAKCQKAYLESSTKDEFVNKVIAFGIVKISYGNGKITLYCTSEDDKSLTIEFHNKFMKLN